MKKHLLTFLVLCVSVCFSTFSAKAQASEFVSCDCPAASNVNGGIPMGPSDPMFILGTSVADDIAASSIPTSAETGTTNYALVVANSDSLVLGLANANGGYDFSAEAPGTYWMVGFAYNQSELVTIASTLDALPAAILAGALGLPVATIEAIQAAIDPATVDLADFFFLLDQLSTTALTLNSLVGSLSGIACGATSGALVAACFATTTIPAYTIEVAEGGGGCGADAGTAIAPLTTYCQDTNNPADLMVTDYVIDPSGVPNIEYVFMVDDTSIVALSEWQDSGADAAFTGFDPETAAPGTYTVAGFAFDQAEVDMITANALVQTLVGVPSGASLAELVEALPGTFIPIPPPGVTVPDPISINQVLDVLNNPTLVSILGFQPCVALSATTFTIVIDDVCTVAATWDECDGAVGIDLATGVSGPYDNTDLTVGGEGTPGCFFDGSVDNSGWISFVGDGNSYFIYSSPECADGLNLADDGTYMPFGDTQIAVYTGDCGTLEEVTCNEDAVAYGAAQETAFGYFAAVTVHTEVGVTYYAMIDGFAGEIGQFCLHAVPAECPNMDVAPGTPAEVTLCNGESFDLFLDDTTLSPGIILQNNPAIAWIVSSEALDEDIFTEGDNGIIIEILPAAASTAFAGNAAGFYTLGNGTVTTSSTVWVTGMVFSHVDAEGNISLDANCASEYSASVQITYYAADAPECSGGPCGGAADANDTCPNAFELTITDGFVNGPYSNDCATGEGDLPADIMECFGDYEDGGAAHDTYDNSVWFSFVGDGSTITLTTNTEGTANPIEDGDTQLAVFEGACDGPAVGCSDDIDFDAGNYASSVTLATTAGTTYYVVVDGFFTGDGFYPDFHSNGQFNIVVTSEGGVEPLEASGVVTTFPLDNNYIVGFTITGGVGPYTYSGVVNGTSDTFGTSFQSDFIPCGTGYSLIVTDSEGNTVTIGEEIVECGVDPLAGSATVTYDGATNSYLVAFSVTGGTEPYSVTGTTGTIPGPGGVYLGEPIACGTDYSYTITDADGTTITLSGTSPEACVTVEPLEGTPTVVYDAASNSYNVSLSITGGTTPYAVTGSAGVTDQGDGNYLSADIACGTDYAFTVTDADGSSLTFTGTSPAECVGVPDIDVDYTINCNTGTGEFTIAFTVSGGLPSIDGGATAYTYSGVVAGSSTDLGTSFNSSIQSDGASFTLVVTDEAGNSTTVSDESVACKLCILDAGDMGDDLVSVCAGNALSVAGTVGQVLDGDAVLSYVLHTNSDTIAGDIIATDANTGDGTADFTFGAGISYGVTYYVSAVVGPDDGAGSPDLSDECARVAAGTPVMFTSPVAVEWDVVCDDITKRGLVTLSVTGGTAPYQVSDFFNGEYTPGMTNTDVNSGFYSVFAVDANGCEGSYADSIDCKKPLVVTWLGFTGEVLATGNLLKWTTAMEANNHHFLVQRSIDGITFETIATVEGAGNSNTAISYDWLDNRAPLGLAYYQIVQVDLDGTESKTNAITLIRGESCISIVSIRPVPATSDVTISLNTNATGAVVVSVYDAAGRVVINTNDNVVAGLNPIRLDVSNLAAGTYFVKVNDGNNVLVSKFVK